MPSIVPGEPCRARTRKPWSCFFICYKYRPFWPRIASATNETVSCTASCTQNMSELSFDVSIRQSPWHVNMNAFLLQLPFYQSITLHNGANNFLSRIFDLQWRSAFLANFLTSSGAHCDAHTVPDTFLPFVTHTTNKLWSDIDTSVPNVVVVVGEQTSILIPNHVDEVVQNVWICNCICIYTV